MIRAGRDSPGSAMEESPQFQNGFFDLFAACVGKRLVIAGNRESAFFQHAERGEIVPGSTRILRAHLYLTQELRQRLGGDALAPVFFSDPVSDFGVAEPFKFRGGYRGQYIYLLTQPGRPFRHTQAQFRDVSNTAAQISWAGCKSALIVTQIAPGSRCADGRGTGRTISEYF